jgi:predicted Zn-dependent peptidase
VNYVGTNPKTYLEVIELILNELIRLKKERIGKDEIKKAKEQVKGGIILGLEDTGNCMSRIAKQEIYFGRYFEVDEILRNIDRVRPEDIQSLAHRLFKSDHLSLASIGPLGDKRLKEVDLSC